jgi:hypothetical protein
MKRPLIWVPLATILVSCRTYDFRSHVSNEAGLVPAEQYAKYGREQAEDVAAGRELAHAGPDSIGQAVEYALGLPDVVNVTADSQGNWLTLHFKSGWRVAVPPVADGKRGADTPGIAAK